MDNNNVVQHMPPIKELVETNMTPKHWITYYINIWLRNAIASSIDVIGDKKLKAEDPEQMVDGGPQVGMIPVKVRLEERKLKVQDALDILAAAKELLAIPDTEFDAKVFSKEALAVDADMIPKPETKPELYKVLKEFGDTKVGEVLELSANSAGWTKEQIDAKVADGTLELIVVKKEGDTKPSPEAKV